MSAVIKVENLGKKYTLHHQQREQYTALRDVITNSIASFGKKILSPFSNLSQSQVTSHQSPTTEDFWALKDVSFEVKQGDRIGIIGRNGAGKSTLLKILSRITEPTTGSVRIKGRVASLLEVGTGFHPELTGRENIFLNGAILGMGRAEIKKKFDEIVDFAEIEKFLDTPVKRYSSGMYVRLAFAVAAHLEPEILIVDEVLAVGDAQFQKKCLGKMEDVSAKEGRTVLFVSHNMEAVRKLCSLGLLFEKGQLADVDFAGKVIQNYLSQDKVQAAFYCLPAPGLQEFGAAKSLVIEDVFGNPIDVIPVGRHWRIRVDFILHKDVQDFVAGLGFLTDLNAPLRTVWSSPRKLSAGAYSAVFYERSITLAPGIYPLVVGLSEMGWTFHYVENAAFLTISDISDDFEAVKLRDVGPILNQMEVDILAHQAI